MRHDARYYQRQHRRENLWALALTTLLGTAFVLWCLTVAGY